MIKSLKKLSANHIEVNKSKYALTLVIILAGIVAGSVAGFHATQNSSSEYTNGIFSVMILSDITRSRIFIDSFLLNLRYVVFIWISGFFLPLIPLNFTEVFAKYFGLGYTSFYMLASCGLKGLAFVLPITIPQIIITLIPFTVYSVYKLNFAFDFAKTRSTGTSYRKRRNLLKRDLFFLCIIVICAALFGIVEAYCSMPILDAVF